MALSVRREIHRRIKDEGRITFAQFMEMALYWPNGGYYSVSSPTGPRGDFYTAPGAHPSFGALLSVQLYQMWLLLDQPRPFWVVEAGAGNGLLCHDSVSFARHLPEDFRVRDLLEVARDNSQKSSQLAKLYIDRCFRLSAGKAEAAR